MALGQARKIPPAEPRIRRILRRARRGTSYIDASKEGVESWPARNGPTRRSDSNAIFDGFEKVEVEEYLTDVFAAKAVDFIDRHKDERFFLMLTPNTPHTPLQATAEYIERYAHVEEAGKRVFAAMVASLDDYVGDVVAALRERGLEENTLVVFFSDNGCVGYLSEEVCSNAPLSGSKRFHLEGGIRVPFIFKWPAALPAGKVYAQPVTAIDLFSTFAAGRRCGRRGPGQREPAAVSERRKRRDAARISLLAVETQHGRALGQVENVEGEQHRSRAR